MPKTGAEPEWFNNDQGSTYIGFLWAHAGSP